MNLISRMYTIDHCKCIYMCMMYIEVYYSNLHLHVHVASLGAFKYELPKAGVVYNVAVGK